MRFEDTKPWSSSDQVKTVCMLHTLLHTSVRDVALMYLIILNTCYILYMLFIQLTLSTYSNCSN